MLLYNIKPFIILIIISLSSLFKSISSLQTEYCIIGAGPAGLQFAYFLEKANRNYIVFERNNISGSFFKTYPRQRKLISLNKRYTGELNNEFNLRHDWHSLIDINGSVVFKFNSNYSTDNFPKADTLLKYLNDFKNKFNLKIKFNTQIKNINCINESVDRIKFKCDFFELIDKNLNKFQCNVLIMANGLSLPNIPVNFKNFEGYESISIEPSDYEGKNVLILGRGNSAFETAQTIYGYTNLIHMVARSRVRNAFSTHYVGDVRALNNDILDTYQLKSLDGFMDLDLDLIDTIRIDDKYYLVEKRNDSMNDKNNFYNQYEINSRIGYDKIIRCLGFKFEFEIFNKSMKLSNLKGRVKKYPKIDGYYESTDYKNLFFVGTNTHSLDFRESSGGFIHGFRYTARALFRIIQNRFYNIKWPSIKLNQMNLINFTLRRINEASGPYQMFGQLVDVITIKGDKFEYYEEIPTLLIPDLNKLTAKSIKNFIVINYEYGKNFSGPGKDVFKLDRVTSDPKQAHKSNFLHPVLYYFKKIPDQLTQNLIKKMSLKEQREYLLNQSTKKHHFLEDFLTFWTDHNKHQIHFRRFIESIVKKDLKIYSKKDCILFHSIYLSYPTMCKLYFQ